jgi:hypothetical protein
MIYGLAVVMLIETPQHNVKVAKRHVPKKALLPGGFGVDFSCY